MMGRGRGGFGFSVCSSGIGASPVGATSVLSIAVEFSCCSVALGSVSGTAAAGGVGRLMMGRGLGGLACDKVPGSVSGVFSSGFSPAGCVSEIGATVNVFPSDAFDGALFPRDTLALDSGIITSPSAGFSSSGLSSEAAGLDKAAGRFMTGRGLGGFGAPSSIGCVELPIPAGVVSAAGLSSIPESNCCSSTGFCKTVGLLMTGLGRGAFRASAVVSLAGAIPSAGCSAAGCSSPCGGFCSAAGRLITGRRRAGLVASASKAAA